MLWSGVALGGRRQGAAGSAAAAPPVCVLGGRWQGAAGSAAAAPPVCVLGLGSRPPLVYLSDAGMVLLAVPQRWLNRCAAWACLAPRFIATVRGGALALRLADTCRAEAGMLVRAVPRGASGACMVSGAMACVGAPPGRGPPWASTLAHGVVGSAEVAPPLRAVCLSSSPPLLAELFAGLVSRL